MDYLLNRKLGEARQHHIRTCTEVVVPTSLTVSEDAFCTILLNLLDNAIEASRKEDDPLLQITIKCVQEYLVCVVRNKVSPDVLAENPDLHTTKADKSSHGFGMKIISQAVERCDGILHYSVEEGFFTVKVMLPLNHHRDG
ncbi:ATPase/histidine kinase/DNA gyrase B/HSP90 domain protein [Pseudoflavonifractor capillosus ATCC 29799]|uniref:ATPase/histidine kinase/DNA gyrase B/HSP90 domain protein n=1 Tax=Pseudoflavonifractor capillosus ATCC 29799 TaxID=411467 RepID=A6NU05_9FIRM|nr:ATP-binding protein [Pseudoflavonifractor capillosus]EDN00352.1 ATPase/histidine kinase/DNA gyrase B/HSP90 domain protein [Pseudoflavonifractor capillosus ATCC 29799]